MSTRSTVAGGMSEATVLGLPLILAITTILPPILVGFFLFITQHKTSAFILAVVVMVIVKKMMDICKDDEQAIFRLLKNWLLAAKTRRFGDGFELEA